MRPHPTPSPNPPQRLRAAALTCCAAAALLVLLLTPATASAYSEFQKVFKESSGRNIDCALCHTHPDGPDGMKAGQIGALTAPELDALNRARTAFDPGQQIDSPILNPFGDSLVFHLGKKRLLALQKDPAALPVALRERAQFQDLDHDGIPDFQELIDGTHPVSNQSGAPLKLFLVGLKENALHLGLLLLATILGLFGLTHLLRWFDIESRRAAPQGDPHAAPTEQSAKLLAHTTPDFLPPPKRPPAPSPAPAPQPTSPPA